MSTWLQAAAQTTDILLVFSGNTATDSNNPLVISGSLTHSWPSATVWPLVLIMTLGGYTCQSHQHGPQVAKQGDITKSSVSSMDSLYPHGSQVSTWPETTLQTTDTNRTSCGNMDYGGPSRRSDFLTLGLSCCPEPGRFHEGAAFSGVESVSA